MGATAQTRKAEDGKDCQAARLDTRTLEVYGSKQACS